MSVSKPTIKNKLLDLYTRARAEEMSDDEFAAEMSDIIGDAVLSITVTVSGVQSGGSTIIGTNT